MDIIEVEEFDLNSIQAEIESTEKAILELETVNIPDGATEAQKEALIKIHPFSVNYQVNHKTLKAKLEYLKCAYEGLEIKKMYAEEKMAKQLL